MRDALAVKLGGECRVAVLLRCVGREDALHDGKVVRWHQLVRAFELVTTARVNLKQSAVSKRGKAESAALEGFL